MKKAALLIGFVLTLSACSPEEIFSLLAQSEVEQGASQAVENSQRVIEEKMAEAESLASQYSDATELSDVTGGTSIGTAYRNQYSSTDGFTHYVTVVVPRPEGENFYEGWLVNPTTGDFISTGRMELDADNISNVLTFTSPTDYTDYAKVVITLETIADDTPEEHILEGSF